MVHNGKIHLVSQWYQKHYKALVPSNEASLLDAAGLRLRSPHILSLALSAPLVI